MSKRVGDYEIVRDYAESHGRITRHCNPSVTQSIDFFSIEDLYDLKYAVEAAIREWEGRRKP